MLKKVLKNITENNMFQSGEKVIVALSGGPDSMCLLHMLHVLSQKLGITLAVAHVNHCLRGEEADEDERYVKKVCEEIKIECYTTRVNIHKLAEEKGISCEMAGREARYAFFQQVKDRINAQKIALAHNANDQAETILMRLMRGTGMDGLIGIPVVRDDIYVRPILALTRVEIEQYCAEQKIQARIDKSNLENIYARNKVRLELIPYMQKNFNSDIIQVLNRLSDTLKKDKEYLEHISTEKYKIYCNKNNGRVIIHKEAFLEHEAILSRIIRMALEELKGTLYNIEKIHINDIIHIQKLGTGKSISLPDGAIALCSYGNIILFFVENKQEIEGEKTYLLEVGGEYTFEKFDLVLQLDVIKEIEGEFNLKGSHSNKYFDLDKIRGAITLRNRKEGDRFTPLGMKGSKKLKSVFIDLKVSKEQRDHIPLLCFGEEIAWIIGYRVSDKFKVDENSKNILRIKVFSREYPR